MTQLNKALSQLPMVVYIASPFTYKCISKHLRYAMEHMRFTIATETIAKLIIRYTIAPIAPITMSYMFRKYLPTLGSEFTAWADTDYAYILQCQEVWVLLMPGWEISVGVLAEIEFAQKHGIPVKFVDIDSLELSDEPKAACS